MDASTFSSLQSQYATLMDIAGQLMARLNGLGPARGEDLGLAKEINDLQGDVEMFVGAVEGMIAQVMAGPGNGNADRWEVTAGQAVIEPDVVGPPLVLNPTVTVSRPPWLRWGLVMGALLLIGGGTFYYYRQQRGVTAAF